jgi:hypothetical protein
MKKLLYISAAALLSLTACTKKYCWKCTTTKGGNGTGATEATYCDETEKSIKNRIGSSTVVDSSGSKPISVVYTTACEKTGG